MIISSCTHFDSIGEIKTNKLLEGLLPTVFFKLNKTTETFMVYCSVVVGSFNSITAGATEVAWKGRALVLAEFSFQNSNDG